VPVVSAKTLLERRLLVPARPRRVHLRRAPRNNGPHTSVVGAMGPRGLVATLAVEGAVDTLCFDACAEQVPGPRFRRGDVAALDNLGAHRASRIEEVAASRGAQVLRPAPYSPDFGPVGRCR